jgi:hypothetical protein
MGGNSFNPYTRRLRKNKLSRLEEVKLEMQEIVSQCGFQGQGVSKSTSKLSYDRFANLMITDVYTGDINKSCSEYNTTYIYDGINVNNIDYTEIVFQNEYYYIVIYLYQDVNYKCTHRAVFNGEKEISEVVNESKDITFAYTKNQQLAIRLKLLLDEFIELTKYK